eukprot:m.230159 g.230159  ORF g.230159 m.230159 type:complete len:69 (-) comp33572_c0_seq14:4100-4306(-)
MPGGQLNFYIYQQLGGELEFKQFWLYLGLPVVLLLVLTLWLFTWPRWQIFAIAVIGTASLGVFTRIIH